MAIVNGRLLSIIKTGSIPTKVTVFPNLSYIDPENSFKRSEPIEFPDLYGVRQWIKALHKGNSFVVFRLESDRSFLGAME